MGALACEFQLECSVDIAISLVVNSLHEPDIIRVSHHENEVVASTLVLLHIEKDVFSRLLEMMEYTLVHLVQRIVGIGEESGCNIRHRASLIGGGSRDITRWYTTIEHVGLS